MGLAHFGQQPQSAWAHSHPGVLYITGFRRRAVRSSHGQRSIIVCMASYAAFRM